MGVLKRLVPAAALLTAGCADPESSRLAVGRKVLAISHNKEHDRLYLSNAGNGIPPAIVQGTHLIVVDDTADPEHDWSSRRVKVHVEDGDAKGMTGVLTRWDLRPE